MTGTLRALGKWMTLRHSSRATTVFGWFDLYVRAGRGIPAARLEHGIQGTTVAGLRPGVVAQDKRSEDRSLRPSTIQ